jgi:hypothetical protein
VFTLSEVVPWGRSFDEYRRMFALTEADLSLRILGCADGPASFNAEATARGNRVISCDPLYRFGADEIRERIEVTYERVIDQTRRNADEFVWDTIESVEDLGRVRMEAMNTFLEDYEPGKREARYIDAQLPVLPFPDRSFDIALCSHFLFLYAAQLTDEFHRASVFELLRVATEVRIFPLLALGGKVSEHVARIVEAVQLAGHYALFETVPYEFQRGGNQMLRLGSSHP